MSEPTTGTPPAPTGPPPGTPGHLFTRAEGTVAATALARGPWSPDALHGGPVAALLAHELQAVESPVPLFPARLTMELHRPVPFGPLRVETTVVRPGRRVRVVEVTLRADDDGRVLARASLGQVERRAVELPDDLEHVNGPERRPPAPEQLPRIPAPDAPRADSRAHFHSDAVVHRTETALLTSRGRATDWTRVTAELFPGEALNRFERVVAAADFGNGLSAVLPFDDYRFLNTDLSVHLFRLPVDDWVCLDAVTRIGLEPGTGSVGQAESALFDRRGRIGRAMQTLLVTESDG